MRSRTLYKHYNPIETMLILSIRDALHQRRPVPALFGLKSAFSGAVLTFLVYAILRWFLNDGLTKLGFLQLE